MILPPPRTEGSKPLITLTGKERPSERVVARAARRMWGWADLKLHFTLSLDTLLHEVHLVNMVLIGHIRSRRPCSVVILLELPVDRRVRRLEGHSRMKRKMPESESSKVFENHRRYLRLGMVEDLLARVHKSLYDVFEPCIYASFPTLFNFAHWSMWFQVII